MGSASIDFSALGQQVTDLINSGNVESTPETPAAPSAPAASEQPPAAVETPSTEQPVTGMEQPPAAPQTYQVDLGNGRVETLTAEQLRDAYQSGLRQADYTRKTQELAAERRQMNEVLGRFQQVLSNPQLTSQLLQRQLQQQQGQPQIDPNAPLTIGAAQQSLAQMQQQMLAQTQEYVSNQITTANYAESINKTVGDVFSTHPVLKVNPQSEDVLRWQVAQKITAQTTLAEAQELFKSEAAAMAKAYDDFYAQRQQQAEAEKAKLAKNGIEPPSSGSAPQPAKPTYMKGGGSRQIDWAALTQAALTNVQQ